MLRGAAQNSTKPDGNLSVLLANRGFHRLLTG